MKQNKKSPSSQGKKAQMRNKRAVRTQNAAKQAAPVAAKPKMEKEQKLFIALLALVLAFSISFLTLGSILLVDVLGDVKYPSVYDQVRLSDYINVGRGVYRNNDVDLSSYYVEPYTLADMDDYLESLRYTHRAEVALNQKLTKLGYGDDFAYYIIRMEQDGKPIMEEEHAAANYTSQLTMTLGKEFLGADFDRALAEAGICPNDTDRELRYNGKITGEDIISLSLHAYGVDQINKTDKASSTFLTTKNTLYAGGRVELASLLEKNAPLAEALIAGCQAIEEEFTFYLENYDLNENGKTESEEKLVKFVATVNFAVVKETTVAVTFTLPTDFFSADSFAGQNMTAAEIANYTALNGKQLTAYLIIPIMNDYELPALDAAFITKTLKFETDKTADADVIAAYKEYALAEQNALLEKSLLNTYTGIMLQQFGEAALANGAFASGQFPAGTLMDAYYEAQEDMVARYINAYGSQPTSTDMEYFTLEHVAKTYGDGMAN